MTRTSITVHIGTWPSPDHPGEPRDGARIELLYPNATDPVVITVTRDGDDWLAQLVAHRPDCLPWFLPRATLADALNDALTFVVAEIEQWQG